MMPWPEEGSCGEHDEPTGQQHLYLIFDDWPWGYSIRKLELPPPRSPHQPEPMPLPPPCICLEAPRRRPLFFAAVGTNIIAAHPRNDFSNSMALECFLPIVDVRSLGVRFGPGLLYAGPNPILISVGDEAPMDGPSSPAPIVPPSPSTPFSSEWKQSSDCSLPFAGRANYVHALDIFVGLSRAPDTYGHLCFCRKLGGGDENVRPGKESHICATLGSDEPGFCLVECVVSITEGNMRVDEGGGNCDQLKKNVDEGSGASGSMQECGELDELKKLVDEGMSASMNDRYLYRLTTFSISFDNNGDLTTGETRVVQCYEVPQEVSEAIYLLNPVAFWL